VHCIGPLLKQKMFRIPNIEYFTFCWYKNTRFYCGGAVLTSPPVGDVHTYVCPFRVPYVRVHRSILDMYCVLCIVCVVRRALCVTVTCVVFYGDVTCVVEGRLKNGFFLTNPTRESRSKSDTQRRIVLLSLDVRWNIPQLLKISTFTDS
jgi:hypothetical protein